MIIRLIKIFTAAVFLFLCQLSLAAEPDLSVAPVARLHRETITGRKARFTVNVTGRTPPVNQSIEIIGPAQGVKINVEGGLDFSSIKALAESITTPGMTDEEKVKACFYFAINSLYDRGSRGCDDPLEYISLWGFSWCGNFGLFLNSLWRALDFQTVFLNPVIGMPSGHTITTVYYDNQWHLYDSRMRSYFLNRDNRTIASLVDLDRDDSLIRRGLDYGNHSMNHWDYFIVMTNYFNAASDWYDGYNAHFNNKTLFNRDCPVWDPGIDLREGEKLTLNWTNQGKWWSRKDLSPRWLQLHTREGREAMTVPPIVYANGTLEFKIDPKKYREQACDFRGIRATGGNSPAFQVSSAGQPGYVVYQVRVPYFIPSMTVQAAGYRKTDADRLAIELSTDGGKTWLPLWEAGRTGHLNAEVTTDRTQRVTWYSPNKYSYLVRFALEASASAADASLGEIKITTDLFYRPMILPALHNGTNRINYSDHSKGRHERQVQFNWLEDTNILFSDDQPCEDDSIRITALVENRGDSPARDVLVRFFDGDPSRGGVQIGEDRIIPELEPGETAQAETGWRAVKRHIGTSHGYSLSREEILDGYTHNTIYVQVDPADDIAESDENNNLTSRRLIVYNKANLVLSDPSFVEFDRQGDRVLITALIRNQNLYGLLPKARPARNVRVRFYHGQPMRQNLDTNMIGEAMIGEIAPGEFGIARVEWDVSGLSGRQRVYVVVDPLDEIPEVWQSGRGKYMQVKKDIYL